MTRARKQSVIVNTDWAGIQNKPSGIAPETVQTVGNLISGAQEKTTLDDADVVGFSDSNDSNILKKFTWANLKTFFSNLYEPKFSKNTAFNKSFGTAAGDVTEGNDNRLSNSREWTAETVSQAEAEAGLATTRRAWTAERVAQAIAALGGGGGGSVDLMDLVRYQTGGWSAAGSRSNPSVFFWGATGGGFTNEYYKGNFVGTYGSYLSQAVNSGVCAVRTGTALYKETSLPTVAVKFGIGGTSKVRSFKIGLSQNPVEAMNESNHNLPNIVLGSFMGYSHPFTGLDMKFITADGASNTQTPAVTIVAGKVYIVVINVASASGVNFYLYDEDYTLLASTTHTTNIPTGDFWFVSIAEGGGQSAPVHQYSGSIILKA